MPLIKCPSCGKDTSDQAGKCPNCGCDINEFVSKKKLEEIRIQREEEKKRYEEQKREEEKKRELLKKIKCPECENLVDKTNVTCPYCGYPIQQDRINKQNEAVQSICKRIENEKKEVHKNILYTIAFGVMSFIFTVLVAMGDVDGIIWLFLIGCIFMTVVCVIGGLMPSMDSLSSMNTQLREIQNNFDAYQKRQDENVKWLENQRKQMAIRNSQTRQQQKPNVPHCPKCGSTAITAGQKGYSLLTGFLGSNKTVNRCANCGHTWQPK